MEIIKKNNLTILQSDAGYMLRSKNDIYVPSYTNENGEIVEEHTPYYFKMAYVPSSITLENAKELYVEEQIKEV
jgi:hypothetical protein